MSAAAAEDRQLPQVGEQLESKRDQYIVRRLLGKGGFGAVFEVTRLSDNRPYAIKCERYDVVKKVLAMDCEVLRGAQKLGSIHFAALLDRGRLEGRFRYLVMKMVGQNLWDLRSACPNHRFSTGTALGVALETLESVKDLHSIGFLHRDLKPGNFAVGREDLAEQRVVYLLDFGLCRKFADQDKDLRRPRATAPFRGTTRYASLCAHKLKDQARKDDLETWLYMIVELTAGTLPWNHLKHDKDAVMRMKEEARTSQGQNDLFKHCPQRQFARLLGYFDSLNYNDVPDYDFVKHIVEHAVAEKGVELKNKYDWEKGADFAAKLPPAAAPYSHLRDD